MLKALVLGGCTLIGLTSAILLVFGFQTHPPGVFIPEGMPPPPPGYVYGPDNKLHKPEPIDPAPDAPDVSSQSKGGYGYGTQDGIDQWIFESEFVPRRSSISYADTSTFYRYATSGTSNLYFEANINLPEGARLSGIRFFFIDNSSTAEMILWYCYVWTDIYGQNPLFNCPKSATTSGAPGTTTHWMPINETIDYRQDINNDGQIEFVNYIVMFQVGEASTAQAFRGVRLFWYRQVSPSPTTATFSDVPTSHPAFRYVEALAASGIVQGCGNGKYCPGQYVTRGQMAVYLSIALGLHWSWRYP